MLDSDVSDGEDYHQDEMYPGSDNELGFEEVEIGDELAQEEEEGDTRQTITGSHCTSSIIHFNIRKQ